MTVTASHALQDETYTNTHTNANVNINSPLKSCAGPPSYVSTRSAAMMALTFGQRFRTASPCQSIDKDEMSSRSNSPVRRKSVMSSNNKTTTTATTTAKTNINTNLSKTTKTSPTTLKSQMPLKSQTNQATENTTTIMKQNFRPIAPSTIAHVNGVQVSGSSGSSSDNDSHSNSASSSATALRRFYFKSGRNCKSKTNLANGTTASDIPMNVVSTSSAVFHTSVIGLPSSTTTVPKLVVMGSSASVTNISTSTDSASTLITNVTHTDTSEACDSLDLGDNSGQSEPLFSSIEEPLLTAIQIDSEQEHYDTELELTNCPHSATRAEMYLQDSLESQESCLSIPTGEAATTMPLLTSQKSQTPQTTQTHNNSTRRRMQEKEKERLPSTAPAPTNSIKHFTFDTPRSPKSARTSEHSRNHFSFKEPIDEDSKRHLMKVKRTNEAIATVTATATRNESARNRNSQQNIHASDVTMTNTSPKRSIRHRSPTSTNRTNSTHSKVNSAPPTMKEGHFFGNITGNARTNKQSSPLTTHTQNMNSRKYSSSSSSGGSDRDRIRDRDRDRERDRDRDRSTMFPFDREAIDYERIQRECFAVNENSSSAASSSDTDEGEACSVYERRLSQHHGSPKSSDIFQHYTLLSQHEQQRPPPSRKNSKRLREDAVQQTTIQEKQKYLPPSDAFQPQPKASNSPGEHSQCSPKSIKDLNKFDDIAMKFEQIPPKQHANELTTSSGSGSSSGNCANIDNNNKTNKMSRHSPTGSVREMTPSQSNLRVDYSTESHSKSIHKRKSLKSGKKTTTTAQISTGADVTAEATIALTHDNLEHCQRKMSNISTNETADFINVTANPMEAAAASTLPRATIVVQQPSLSLDNTVETVLIKNEGDFISVEASKELLTSNNAPSRKRSQQHTTYHLQHSHQQQLQQLQQHQQHHGQPNAHKHEENIRQLLDVTNARHEWTFEELRDFEMRYGSPHHNRSQSVKAPGRASGRPNQLCLPQQRLRIASMPNTGTEEEYYRLRHFSITGKGIVNRGDSLKSRRSRSNNSVASSNSSTEHLSAPQLPAPTSARNSANCSLASSRESSTSNPGSGPYKVLMLGGPAVGKSSLVSQFMTSEYLHAYDTSIEIYDNLLNNCDIQIQIEKPGDDDDSGEKSVSVLLNQEESELTFIDHSYSEITPDDCLANYDNPHGYCVIYSSSDRSSFVIAEHILQVLWTNQNIAQKAVILVSNKSDLARSRIITPEEGKAMATAYDCKFIETSVSINHNVDELLVGLLSQIRLKLENPEKTRDLFRKRSIRKSKRRACSPLGGTCLTGGTNPNTPVIANVNTPPGSAQSSPRKYRGSRTSTSLKVKGLLGRVWARDSKSKSCENLHVL